MVYENYCEQKEKYKNCLVMVKVGNFYHTYEEDSVILHYLFHYKRKDELVGFPVNTLKKVLRILDKNYIGYYIEGQEKQNYNNNQYQDVLEKASLYLELEEDVEEIYQYLMDNIERKYIKRVITKIKDIIDEG